ncbi:MAG: RNA polymerase sigma-70 factor [Macellibacteroides fermentans]|uniref:RNA polymerase sigma-70 factor n=1 Tax=Macellibacteroides fermentans TaxID=879969 RepID=UPI002B7D18E0|nr:RNA polymerase sigma-70 factor [Macellibacteroides fermentans]
MEIKQVDKGLIVRINNDSEDAFSMLYKAYYSYLNAIAIYYLFDKNISSEVVNDVFLNVWDKRKELNYPIHSYLVKSVQNGCLNYIRSQKTRSSIYDSYSEEISKMEEIHILSNPEPLRNIELKETECQIKEAIEHLPLKCRLIFECYFYEGKSPEEIAIQTNISVSTVRVQIKNALDRLKQLLNHLLFILFCLNI